MPAKKTTKPSEAKRTQAPHTAGLVQDSSQQIWLAGLPNGGKEVQKPLFYRVQQHKIRQIPQRLHQLQKLQVGLRVLFLLILHSPSS